MRKVLDLIWVRWQQIFFGKSEKKDSTAGKSPTAVARMERSAIRGRRRVSPGFRGVYHRARIRATRWRHPGYDVRQRHCEKRLVPRSSTSPTRKSSHRGESRFRVPGAAQRPFGGAPQSRNPQQSERHDGPRISSAPRRKRGLLRSIRGTSARVPNPARPPRRRLQDLEVRQQADPDRPNGRNGVPIRP